MSLEENIQKLIKYINRKEWWHVPPMDPTSYEKRGKFFSASFREAEFYGRPNDVPNRVSISSPLVGDNDTIERELLGRVESHPEISIPKRLALDAKLRRAALRNGYDSIVLMSPGGFQKFREEGKIPRSIELNVVELRCLKT